MCLRLSTSLCSAIPIWIGGWRSAGSSSWLWKSQWYTTPMSYTMWTAGGPNISSSSEACVQTSDGSWNDTLCSATSTFLCEIDVDVCSSAPCQNRGTCVNSDATSYTCNCVSGYTGINCQNGKPICRMLLDGINDNESII